MPNLLIVRVLPGAGVDPAIIYGQSWTEAIQSDWELRHRGAGSLSVKLALARLSAKSALPNHPVKV